MEVRFLSVPLCSPLLSSCLWILCLCGDSCSNSISDAAAAFPLRSVVSSSLWFHTSFSSLICNPPQPCTAIYSWPIYSHFDVGDESGAGERENPISTLTFSIVARGGGCSRDIVICCCCQTTRMEAPGCRARWEPAWEQTTWFSISGFTSGLEPAENIHRLASWRKEAFLSDKENSAFSKEAVNGRLHMVFPRELSTVCAH